MLRLFVGLLLFAQIAYGAVGKIDVEANELDANAQRHSVKLKGKVSIVNGKSNLHADFAELFFDEQNQTKAFDARGNVTFYIEQNGSRYQGRAQMLHYDVKKEHYHLENDVYVEDLINRRQLKGQRLNIDLIQKNVMVEGKSNQPIRMSFELGK